MSGFPSDRHHVSQRDIDEKRLRYREDMLDRWERDLRSREDALLEGRVIPVYHNSMRTRRDPHRRNYDSNGRRRKRRREDIDYSTFAVQVAPNRVGNDRDQPSPNVTVSNQDVN